MFKIRKVEFINHPILGDLTLDFCDASGHAVDTVIFAGENGVGKSTILNALYELSANNTKTELNLEIERTEGIEVLQYRRDERNNLIYVFDSTKSGYYIGSDDFKQIYNFHGIFSDVDINFHSNDLSNVTSLALDQKIESRRSSNNLPTEIQG